MRDGDDRSVEGADQLLELLARLHVEVRLGLVEQQDVGVAQQARGEPDELPAAAREDAASPSRRSSPREPDLGEQRARPTREAGPAGGSPALEHLLLPPQQPRHAVEVGAHLPERPLDHGQFALELV